MLSKNQLKPGEHIWVVYKNKLVLGVILEAYKYGFEKTLHYKVIIPISSSKCSVIIRAHTDKGIFNLSEEEAANAWLEQYDKTRTRKPKSTLKKYKLPKR